MYSYQRVYFAYHFKVKPIQLCIHTHTRFTQTGKVTRSDQQIIFISVHSAYKKKQIRAQASIFNHTLIPPTFFRKSIFVSVRDVFYTERIQKIKKYRRAWHGERRRVEQKRKIIQNIYLLYFCNHVIPKLHIHTNTM